MDIRSRSVAFRLLQILLGFISLFHVVMGTGLMFSPGFQAGAAALYGAHVDWTPQAIYLVRILGSFAFVFGILALAAARRPLQNQAIIYGFIALFLLRDAHRLLFNAEIQAAFGLASRTNTMTNGFFLAQTVLLYVLLRVTQRA